MSQFAPIFCFLGIAAFACVRVADTEWKVGLKWAAASFFVVAATLFADDYLYSGFVQQFFSKN
ncbi:hypothetical protein [Ponticaulis profundi]|uniref:Uncharacterized protein n=1 Tax=Ponticaulis profundi TaxID=2665222 RepID=A0ABW1S6P4_9PROT